jgi:hypothetical protein
MELKATAKRFKHRPGIKKNGFPFLSIRYLFIKSDI